MLKIAITGANGFVAKNLRYLLHLYKIPVLAISRKRFQRYPLEISIVTRDYSESDILCELKNCSSLVHLIGIGQQTTNSDYDLVNVSLTKKIIQMAKKSKINKIVYCSGLGVSRSTQIGYFISKYRAEQSIIHSNLNYTIFRPSYIIGINDPLSQNLTKQIKESNSIIIPGSGKFIIQPIFVGDVSYIILESIKNAKFSNKIIDLVGPQKITFEEFVRSFLSYQKQTKTRNIKIQKINLEDSYYRSIHNKKFPYGIDDLNILVGNFVGNSDKLQRLIRFDLTKYNHVLDLR